jgi:hypothetical protein
MGYNVRYPCQSTVGRVDFLTPAKPTLAVAQTSGSGGAQENSIRQKS